MSTRGNPTGMRTVTIIVTHDDSSRDFSRTYTTRQIKRGGAGYVETYGDWQVDPFTREWSLTTFEEMPEQLQDNAWSLPIKEAK